VAYKIFFIYNDFEIQAHASLNFYGLLVPERFTNLIVENDLMAQTK